MNYECNEHEYIEKFNGLNYEVNPTIDLWLLVGDFFMNAVKTEIRAAREFDEF